MPCQQGSLFPAVSHNDLQSKARVSPGLSCFTGDYTPGPLESDHFCLNKSDPSILKSDHKGRSQYSITFWICQNNTGTEIKRVVWVVDQKMLHQRLERTQTGSFVLLKTVASWTLAAVASDAVDASVGTGRVLE